MRLNLKLGTLHARSIAYQKGWRNNRPAAYCNTLGILKTPITFVSYMSWWVRTCAKFCVTWIQNCKSLKSSHCSTKLCSLLPSAMSRTSSIGTSNSITFWLTRWRMMVRLSWSSLILASHATTIHWTHRQDAVDPCSQLLQKSCRKIITGLKLIAGPSEWVCTSWSQQNCPFTLKQMTVSSRA